MHKKEENCKNYLKFSFLFSLAYDWFSDCHKLSENNNLKAGNIKESGTFRTRLAPVRQNIFQWGENHQQAKALNYHVDRVHNEVVNRTVWNTNDEKIEMWKRIYIDRFIYIACRICHYFSWTDSIKPSLIFSNFWCCISKGSPFRLFRDHNSYRYAVWRS